MRVPPKYLLLAIALLYSLGCVRYSATSTPIAAPYSIEDRAMMDRDPQGLSVSRTVARQLYRLMRRAVRDQREPDACVLSYRVWYGVDSARKVDVYALTLAEDDSSDAMSIYSRTGLICPPGVPSIHGHILRDWVLSQPSAADSATLVRSLAPFDVLAFRLNSDSAFGLRLFWRDQ